MKVESKTTGKKKGKSSNSKQCSLRNTILVRVDEIEGMQEANNCRRLLQKYAPEQNIAPLSKCNSKHSIQ